MVTGAPEPIDASQYHSTFKFKSNSRLHRALARKCPETITITNRYYTLYSILTLLKKLIKDEELYDKENPQIIILNLLLEIALGVRVLHVSQVKEFVLAQMESTNLLPIRPTNRKVYRRVQADINPEPDPNRSNHVFMLPEWGSVNSKSNQYRLNADLNFDVNAKYRVDNRLLAVLLSDLPESDRVPRDYYNYATICKMVSDFIIANKDTLFDLRNIHVAIIEDHPLGEVFGTRAIARSQITYFIKAFLTLYVEEPAPPQAPQAPVLQPTPAPAPSPAANNNDSEAEATPMPSAPPAESDDDDDDEFEGPLVIDEKKEVVNEPDTTK